MFRLTAKTSQILHNIHTIKKQCQCIALHTGQAIHDNKEQITTYQNRMCLALTCWVTLFCCFTPKIGGQTCYK